MSEAADTRSASTADRRAEVAAWKEVVAKFQTPSRWRACWQIVDTFGLYLLLWWLMGVAARASLWLALPLAALAGGVLVRVFIIFHDCGHGSFFASRRANAVWGFFAGVLTFTPYYHWRWEHAIHHATSGALDRRGVGDVWTLTVREYLESSRWKRLAYRLARNPFVLFVVAPLYLFLIRQRVPSPDANLRERRSVLWMNLAIAAVAAAGIAALGALAYVTLQLVVMAVAGALGVWLFYVQHQFEDVYWARDEEWDYTDAALRGSSFYRLPRVLQWFSGNIGFHHIHHLSPRVPNYHLQKCHESHPMFRSVKPITLRSSLKSIKYRLWDEQARRLVSFRHLRRRRVEGERDA